MVVAWVGALGEEAWLRPVEAHFDKLLILTVVCNTIRLAGIAFFRNPIPNEGENLRTAIKPALDLKSLVLRRWRGKR